MRHVWAFSPFDQIHTGATDSNNESIINYDRIELTKLKLGTATTLRDLGLSDVRPNNIGSPSNTVL
jgi:hypothetical protein